MTELIQTAKSGLTAEPWNRLPALIENAGPDARRRFVEFFTATIRNRNTREAYGRAVRDFFVWCEWQEIGPLAAIEPTHVSVYIEAMTDNRSPQTVKQHLAAIRRLFDWLVVGQIVPTNPASYVKGPRFSQETGSTEILTSGEARELIDSISPDTLGGLRDRAIIATMVFTFARVSAALALDVEDVFRRQHRMHLQLQEKNGKRIVRPCHHSLEEYLQAYIEAAGLKTGPLFRTFERAPGRPLSETRLQRRECLAMVKRRCKKAGLDGGRLCNHTFRGTGITAYLQHPGARDKHAQRMAGHVDPKTTLLYDRRDDRITLDEVEKIQI